MAVGEFIQVALKLVRADAVEGPQEPLFQVPHRSVGEGHHVGGAMPNIGS